ncbi:hypothetical protein FSARC_10177 [Fusarium sarcochroum]|uniref:Myb-like domain-containing protein n=1 Tax=Fusarium sarcochroum TaxID=1208366 RepID=A0A8H4TNZ5_9HYPO|nr:hypothetical protein FSARC_10177 [Fusarium sarcochroum]
MPPKKSTSGEDGGVTGLTDGELRFIKAIFDNMTQKPDADWDAVAETLSLKDAKCAKERFRQMSVRHGWRNDQAAASPRKGGASAPDKVTKKPRAPRKKIAKKTDEDDEVKEEAKAEKTEKAEDKKEVKSEEQDDDMD